MNYNFPSLLALKVANIDKIVPTYGLKAVEAFRDEVRLSIVLSAILLGSHFGLLGTSAWSDTTHYHRPARAPLDTRQLVVLARP